MKEYGKVKAFRLQAAEETKLEECFDWLQVSGDNFNQRMNDFIARVHTFFSQNAADHKSHPAPAKGLVKEHAEDRDLYKKYAKDFQTERSSLAQQKRSEYLGCPLRDNWVTKEDCDKCRLTNFPAWSDCHNRRRKNPDDPIFKISKPKPEAS